MYEDILALLIPIIAIIGGITAGIFSMYFKYRTRQNFFNDRVKLIDAMRESGEFNTEKMKQLQDPAVMESFMGKFDTRGDRNGNLKAGIILIAVAIALWAMTALLVQIEGEEASVQATALFPGLLGLAFLLIHFICKPKNGNGEKNDDMRKFQ